VREYRFALGSAFRAHPLILAVSFPWHRWHNQVTSSGFE